MDKLVWLDLETTGFEPEDCEILEIGMLITDADLEVLDAFQVVLKGYPPILTQDMDANVIEMHTASGLFFDVKASDVSRSEAESRAIAFLETHFGPAKVKEDGTPDRREMPPLGGSSVHFDRKFLAYHMPALERCFHYRNFDATSIGEAARRWYPEEFVEREKSRDHRALADLHDMLLELRYIRATFWSFNR